MLDVLFQKSVFNRRVIFLYRVEIVLPFRTWMLEQKLLNQSANPIMSLLNFKAKEYGLIGCLNSLELN